MSRTVIYFDFSLVCESKIVIWDEEASFLYGILEGWLSSFFKSEKRVAGGSLYNFGTTIFNCSMWISIIQMNAFYKLTELRVHLCFTSAPFRAFLMRYSGNFSCYSLSLITWFYKVEFDF